MATKILNFCLFFGALLRVHCQSSSLSSAPASWGKNLLNNLDLLSSTVHQEISPTVSAFLAAPETTVIQMLKDKCSAKVRAESMLTYVLDETKLQLLEDVLVTGVQRLGESVDCAEQVPPAAAQGEAVQILRDFELLETNRESDCYVQDARYSGSDYQGGTLVEGIAQSAQECQMSCMYEPECKFFTYFKADHFQEAKRRVCRLLRFDIELKENQPGHASGPKFCPGVYYPRTFAKSLLNFISAASEGWRQVRCQTQRVVNSSKETVDAMFFLTEEEERAARLGDLCPVEAKLFKFLEDLKNIDSSVLGLLQPILSSVNNITAGSNGAAKARELLGTYATAMGRTSPPSCQAPRTLALVGRATGTSGTTVSPPSILIQGLYNKFNP